MTPTTNILECLRDDKLLGAVFKDASTWSAWFVFFAALFALPMTARERRIYRKHTGRKRVPSKPAREAWLVCGRRSGKSFSLALTAVYLAAFRNWAASLGVGERATIMIISADRKQSRVVMRYIKGIVAACPMIAQMVEAERAEAVDLDNRASIEVHTASFRSTRGYTIVACLCDEIAFWPSDENAAEPDRMVLDALRPGMATIPDGVLICASTPFARRGEIYRAFEEYFGRDGDVLVWRAASREMNATIPRSIIRDALKRDPAVGASEYLGQWRADISDFLTHDEIASVVDRRCHERPPDDALSYRAFADVSGGRHDASVVAISHLGLNNIAILDALSIVKGRHDPIEAINQHAELLRRYGVSWVTGDKYGANFTTSGFREAGIDYVASVLTRSDLFLELGATIRAGACRLLDREDLANELRGLQRRALTNGRSMIDHPAHGSDDVANACAGAIYAAKRLAATYADFGEEAFYTVSPSPAMAALRSGASLDDLDGEVASVDSWDTWSAGRDAADSFWSDFPMSGD